MSKIVTLEQIIRFQAVAQVILNKSNNKKHPVLYAIQKMAQKTKKEYEKYLDIVEWQKLGLAGKDNDGYILQDDKGNYKMTPESKKQLNSFVREKQAETVEIEPYIATVEMDFDLLTRSALTPFIFEEVTEGDLDKEIG